MSDSSESETNLEDINIWNVKKFKKDGKEETDINNKLEKCNETFQTRFDQIKQKLEKQREIDFKLEQRREKRKNYRLLKKIYRDPHLMKAIDDEIGEDTNENETDSQSTSGESWSDIKPYLNVNGHLAGPVSHGKYGPKTELESMIDKAIDEGDFEKAEQLSDHLSNREFGTKITQAFAAKRYADKKTEYDAIQKAKKLKKLNWGFEAKERWEMKGNM
ncbi:protein FAM204A-like [Centruroides vittatus]|uniref:protein FAM204A-like n=1 Tax=Centruroides vittatus TaxID=120091 RepID=UPI00350EAB2C